MLNVLTLRHKNRIFNYSSKNAKVLLKIQWIFVIVLSLFVIRNFWCTCSSAEMPKGYMVRERLEPPALKRSDTQWCRMPLWPPWGFVCLFISLLFFRSRNVVKKWEEPHDNTIYCLACDSAHMIVSGSCRHGVTRIWDTRRTRCLQVILLFYINGPKHAAREPHVPRSAKFFSNIFFQIYFE